MISKAKKYFSFFGMLSMSVDMQTRAFYAAIHALNEHTIKVTLTLQQQLLQPTYTSSTNTL